MLAVSLSPFQHDGEALTHADADRHDGDAASASRKLMRGMPENAAPRSAQRMADGQRSAVDVDPLRIKFRPPGDACERL